MIAQASNPKAFGSAWATRNGWALTSNGAATPRWVIRAGAPVGAAPTIFASDAEAYARAVGMASFSAVAAEALALHGTPYTGAPS